MKHGLVREGIVVAVEKVVVAEQVLSRKAGGPLLGKDEGAPTVSAKARPHIPSVSLARPSACFVPAPARSDRPPNCTGVLEEVAVVGAEGGRWVEVAGTGIVLVQEPHFAVVDGERRSRRRGPSVGEVMVAIITRRPSSSTGSPLWSGGTKRNQVRPVRRAGRLSGSRAGARSSSSGLKRRSTSGIEVVFVQVRDVEVVARIAAKSTLLLSGKTNQEAKYAGHRHGSQRMEPAAVSMNRPAWPVQVIFMAGRRQR